MARTRRVGFSRKRRRGGRKTVKRKGGRRRSRVTKRRGGRKTVKRRGGKRRSRTRCRGRNSLNGGGLSDAIGVFVGLFKPKSPYALKPTKSTAAEEAREGSMEGPHPE